MLSETNPSLIDDLRFALQVLQERSGLGLDSEYASKIQSVILQQIERGEASRRPSVAAPASLDRESVAA
jgi:hypothetical protein